MNLQAVSIPPRERRIGSYVRDHNDREHETAIKRHIVFKHDWRMSVSECGERRYYARINDSLVLNVHRRPNSRTWEYLVVGFDLTKDEAPVIGIVGTAGTMKEAKYKAEEQIPANSPGTNTTIWDDEVPF